jgi:hypothetical protein
MNSIRPFPIINNSKVLLEGSDLLSFSCYGELGFRTNWIIDRLENQRPFSKEYIVGQISGDPGIWTNFPRVHGDIAGRWVLAETVIHSNDKKVPKQLREIVDAILDLQDEDGSFGCIHKKDQNLNMHKMYGNGWLLRGLTQFAFTFDDERVKEAVTRLGDFYISEFPLWVGFDLGECDTGFYAITRSCYFHAADGLVSLFRLTRDKKYLDLVGSFIPYLTPYETSDHSHMFLTIQRGLIEYYLETGNLKAIKEIGYCLDDINEKEIFENGGVPERFHFEGDEGSVDEGCSLFDWFFCCIRLYEVQRETRWIDRAILTLENAIYFNQTYNGGFGSIEIGSHLMPNCKEAPWCCSLYGGWALSRIGGHLLNPNEKNGVLTVLYPVSGIWNFKKASFRVEIDEKKGKLEVQCLLGTFQTVRLYVPHWMSVDNHSNTFVSFSFLDKSAKVDFSYLPWLSRVGGSPCLVQGEIPKTVELFYGPYLLAHRGNTAKPFADSKGSISYLKGFPYFPESFRYIVPSHITYSIHDVFLGVSEKNNQLYLYPVKDKESPDGISTHLVLNEEQ